MDLPQRLTDLGGPNHPDIIAAFSFKPPGTNTTISAVPDPSCFLPGLINGGTNGTNSTNNGTFIPPPLLVPIKENPALTHYFNDGGNVTTLNHTLFSWGMIPNATIGDVMDVDGDYVCVEYL